MCLPAPCAWASGHIARAPCARLCPGCARDSVCLASRHAPLAHVFVSGCLAGQHSGAGAQGQARACPWSGGSGGALQARQNQQGPLSHPSRQDLPRRPPRLPCARAGKAAAACAALGSPQRGLGKAVRLGKTLGTGGGARDPPWPSSSGPHPSRPAVSPARSWAPGTEMRFRCMCLRGAASPQGQAGTGFGRARSLLSWGKQRLLWDIRGTLGSQEACGSRRRQGCAETVSPARAGGGSERRSGLPTRLKCRQGLPCPALSP